jgi:hypothetical protein
MDIIDIAIYFVNAFNIAIGLGIITIIFSPIFTFIFGPFAFGYIQGFLYSCLIIFTSVFPSWTLIPYLLITIFFIIMYIIYLIIITIIPETGIATLFIPVRELLLAIPPIPALNDKGVFPFFTSVIKLFGVNNTISAKLRSFSVDYYYFSKGSIVEMMQIFNPNMDVNKTIEQMQNYNKASEMRNLKNDVEVCIYSNANLTTPDMNFTGTFKNNINDIKNTITCNLKSIGPYINPET